MRILHRGITASRDACVVSPFAAANVAHRKQWIQERLEHLRGFFSIEGAGFVVMDNHMHLLLRLDSQRAAQWSSQEVLRGGGSSCFLWPTATASARRDGMPASSGLPEICEVGQQDPHTARRSWLVYEVLEGTDRQASEPRGRCDGVFLGKDATRASLSWTRRACWPRPLIST